MSPAWRMAKAVEALLLTPHTVQSLRHALGWSERVTVEALGECRRHGLAHRRDGQWHAGPPTTTPNSAHLDAGWMRAIEGLQDDLTPEEWAERIGCSVAEVELALTWARRAEAA